MKLVTSSPFGSVKLMGIPTVLCIENEASIRGFMGRLLQRKFGAEVKFVASGEEAISAIKEKGDWNLVVSDWHLDGANGGEVLAWVIRAAPHLLTKYVFMSSSSDAERSAVELGIPIINKPAGMDAIYNTLRPFLQS